MAKKVLGKGLGAIISTSSQPADDFEDVIIDDKNRVIEIETSKIVPNPDQPRLHFDEHEIEGLAASIESVGLIQPIIVRKSMDGYIIIAGERRFRATKMLNKSRIKAIIIEATEVENLTIALIENVQRSNLDPIEEAKAYKVLINRFKLKQQDLASRVGKDRATIANSLRLLNLPQEIQEGLSENKISTGHAKIILSISGVSKQRAMYDEVISKGLSVRALEQYLKETGENEAPEKNTPAAKKEAHIKQMEEKLIALLGTKVEIRHSGGKGKIEISYYSLDDFDRIIDLLK